MKKINRTDKILSVSHYDLDGVVSQIILKAVFKNITFVNSKFGPELHRLLESIDYYIYDWVILTDIHPDDFDLLNLSNNILLLDHHESAKELNDPKNKKIILTKFCGAAVTKYFFENYFKMNLNKFNSIVKYTNDYDLWIHNWRKSIHFNWLFWKYHPLRFRNEFSDGRIKFTDWEIDYLKKQEIKLKKIVNNVKIYDFKNTKAGLIQYNSFLNETSDYLLKKKGYKLIISLDNKNKKVSIRHNMINVHIGNILKENSWGGGHKEAGGMADTDVYKLQENVDNLISYLYNNYPEIRKE